MPIFRFDCEGCLWASEDALEVELPSVREAQIEAIEHLAEMLRGRAEEFWQHRDVRITVSDRTGLNLFSLDLTGVLAPTIRREDHRQEDD